MAKLLGKKGEKEGGTGVCGRAPRKKKGKELVFWLLGWRKKKGEEVGATRVNAEKREGRKKRIYLIPSRFAERKERRRDPLYFYADKSFWKGEKKKILMAYLYLLNAAGEKKKRKKRGGGSVQGKSRNILLIMKGERQPGLEVWGRRTSDEKKKKRKKERLPASIGQ